MNTMMRDRLIVVCVTMVLIFGLASCSTESQQSGEDIPTLESDRREIQETLTEIAVRWSYGDKVVLYEQEFEYIQVEHTYDSYLEIERIKRMESDTVVAFEVKDIEFFERDSALVAVDVVFVGPTEDTTRLAQQWMMYYHLGKWIRPTLSSIKYQLDFEDRRRQADSAAAAEEEDEDW